MKHSDFQEQHHWLCGLSEYFRFTEAYDEEFELIFRALYHDNKYRKRDLLINMAKNELKLLGYEDEINVDTIESCDIDVTPTLCPYIYMIPDTNIINIHGFSGSGSMIMDKNFIKLVVDSLVNSKINKNLEVFAPTKNLFKNNFVHEDKKTPLSSVV